MTTPPTVAQQLADLQARVQQLEAAQGDTLTPAVFNLNAAGELEEILSGKLKAKGVILPNGLVIGGGVFGPGVVEKSEIQWQEEPGGAIVASIGSSRIASKPPALFSGQETQLTAQAEGMLVQLGLLLEKTPVEVAQLIATAKAGFTPRSVTVIDSKGRSSFVQLAGVIGNRQVAFGSSHCTWTVKGSESGKAEVVLPAGFEEPTSILLSPVGFIGTFRVFEGGPYKGKFNVIANNRAGEESAIGAEAFFFWLAIG